MFVLFVQGDHTFGEKTPTHHLCLIIFAIYYGKWYRHPGPFAGKCNICK